MRRNWKTTFFGITSILSGVATIFKGDIYTGVSIITTGIGLIFSKDYDTK
jgi:hypothetical protein